MGTCRLIVALLLPALTVGVGLHLMGDARWTLLLYLFVGCASGPWILLGARPWTGRGGFPLRRSGERLSAPTALPLALLLFGPVFLGLYALLRPWVVDPARTLQTLARLGWSSEHEFLLLLLFLVLVPWFEEWWWRGQALPRALRTFGRSRGIAVAVFGFALHHLVVLLHLHDPGPALLRLSGVLVASMVWTLVAYRRGSWIWTLAAHAAADLVLVIAHLAWVRPAG